MHEDEGQLGGELAAQRPQEELHLHRVGDDDAERVALVGGGQSASRHESVK